MTFTKTIRKTPVAWVYQLVRGRYYKMCSECFNHQWWCGEGKCTRCYYDSMEVKEIKKSNFFVRLADKTLPERIKYAKDLIQPFQSDGTVNPKFVEAYKTDPRNDQGHRSYARNVNNRGFSKNIGVDADMRKWEKKKYGL